MNGRDAEARLARLVALLGGLTLTLLAFVLYVNFGAGYAF